MASVQKRPDGKWRARYRDDDNVEHARHFRRKIDAHDWLDEVIIARGSRAERTAYNRGTDSRGRDAALLARRASRERSAKSQRGVPPVALYRHFDAKGRLLYVGITVDVHSRTRTHAGYSAWAPDAATGTITWYATEVDARAAETVAIKAERPRWNRLSAVDEGVV